MFEPGSVCDTKNNRHPVCDLPDMLQQQCEEGNQLPVRNDTCLQALQILFPSPIYAPFFTFQFHISFCTRIHVLVKCPFFFIFHKSHVKVVFFSRNKRKKKAFIFCPVLKGLLPGSQ